MSCIRCAAELPDGAKFCPSCGKKQVAQPRKALKRANGTGTIYKLQGRRTRPWVAAKGRVVIGYYPRKTDAIEALERLSGRDLSEAYNMTFAEVFADWKSEHYREIGPQGIAGYDRAFDVFAPLHGKKFRELRTVDFQTVIDQYKEKSHSTVSKYKHLLTQMSDWAVREQLISSNLAKFVKVPEEQKKEKEIFSESDIAALERDGSETAKVVLMLIYTGMRISELFELPLTNYHGDYVIGGVKTEAGKNRIIPIRPEGRAYFAEFAEKAAGPLLLSGYNGQRDPSNFRKREFYPLLERLGIDRKTPHATRHTYASRARKEGMRPEVLQKILGHASYTTTANIYVHADLDEILAAVDPQKKQKIRPLYR